MKNPGGAIHFLSGNDSILDSSDFF
ncbi:hypothetical protein NITGR_730037 [Nitrospina gracilis 3/211]|uniref:Uncharacterized protein n=1 Tax=Nitrospina gracilis (strain 3/211) TaxID=1266370 RepID=M1Z0T1_NITG3|nr:hypothetical protein NITGR_730037 [Nitrospina gracilis 3/211]